jgi:hypothetical protein
VESELFSVHWIGKIKVFCTMISRGGLNFSVLELSGGARVAIELRIDSGDSSELLAINRQDETDGEIAEANAVVAGGPATSVGRQPDHHCARGSGHRGFCGGD